MKRQFFLLLGLVLLLASCTKEPGDYPDEPQIYYQSTSPRSIDIGDTSGIVRIELKFTDGDGDIGRDATQSQLNIFLKDTRDTTTAQDYTYRYPFPYIDNYMRPKKDGLEGFITINLGKQYFPITDSLNIALRKDTLQFRIYIQDDAGHKSNVITTDTIYLSF